MTGKTVKTNKAQFQLIELVSVFVAVYLFFSFVIIWGTVPSSSMEPTLNVGDIVLTNGLAYINHEPQRGDIIIFTSQEDEIQGETLIKRVIGIPGDDLMFIDGYIYVNGKLCYEKYLMPDIETNCAKDYIVPENCYFVMGDNRENSFDSRFWENPYVNKDDIKGKMIADIPVSTLIGTVKSIIGF